MPVVNATSFAMELDEMIFAEAKSFATQSVWEVTFVEAESFSVVNFGPFSS